MSVQSGLILEKIYELFLGPLYLSLCRRELEWGGGGRLFEAGRLLTVLPLGGALIRGGR